MAELLSCNAMRGLLKSVALSGQPGCLFRQALHTALHYKDRADALEKRVRELETAHPLDAWHEDIGDVLWWMFPVEEPPYSGSPLDSDWPGYHTHWTLLSIPPTPKED